MKNLSLKIDQLEARLATAIVGYQLKRIVSPGMSRWNTLRFAWSKSVAMNTTKTF